MSNTQNTNSPAPSSSLRSQTINLGAGPSTLSTSVLTTAASGLLDYSSTGIGITELSHRSSTFVNLNRKAQDDIKALLDVPDTHSVLFMQGGGLTQFAAVVLNLVAWWRTKHEIGSKDKDKEGVRWKGDPKVEYLVTGSWSAKAAGEAKRLGAEVNLVVDSRKNSKDAKLFGLIPDQKEWNWSKGIDETDPTTKPAFIYYCDNETVAGVEFPSSSSVHSALPDSHRDVPIVADMSSNILSRKVDVSKFGIIYAGAQKNIGPSGLTVVIIRKDLIVDTDVATEKWGNDRIPSMLSYKNHEDSDSLYNTPAMFSIYVSGLVFEDLLKQGGVSAIEKTNEEKAKRVYEILDKYPDVFLAPVSKTNRSRMNVVFRIQGGEEKEKEFIDKAGEKGIKQIKGHRSVGGIRTSLYNAVTLDQVDVLCTFMVGFAKAFS